jgi:hypothetical protein
MVTTKLTHAQPGQWAGRNMPSHYSSKRHRILPTFRIAALPLQVVLVSLYNGTSRKTSLCSPQATVELRRMISTRLSPG